jgi:dCTP deaminase
MSTLILENLKSRLNKDSEDSIIVTPILDFDTQVNEIGIDCRLGNQFIIFKTQNIESIDIKLFSNNSFNANNIQEEVVVPFKEYFILHPQNMVLGSTLEYIGIPHDIEASIEGRSSWARYGLIIATAVSIEPGFKGCITLELANISNIPIKLYPGMRIAQLICRETSSRVEYENKKYLYPIGPEVSKLHMDKDIRFFVESN